MENQTKHTVKARCPLLLDTIEALCPGAVMGSCYDPHLHLLGGGDRLESDFSGGQWVSCSLLALKPGLAQFRCLSSSTSESEKLSWLLEQSLAVWS